MKAHETAADFLERESGSASERDAVTLREFLRVQQFRQACKGFGSDILIEFVYGTQFRTALVVFLSTSITTLHSWKEDLV
jgi:hypothetical protein